MRHDFLSEFMGNPHRGKMVRALIFNENERFTAKDAGKRSGVSPVAAARELKALEKIGIAKRGRIVPTTPSGAKKRLKPEVAWFLNPNFKYLRALSSFVREIAPMRYEQIVDALRRSGKLSTVILSGSFMGDLSRPADILLAGDSLNEKRLEVAVKELEPLFGRELRYAAFTTPEFRYRLTVQDRLIRDTLDYPHLILLDRSRLL